MELLRSWVFNVAVTLIFITAVEMILPDNSIKKYAKFILGLILVAVILTPILEIFNGAEEKVSTQINKFQNESEKVSNEENSSTEKVKEKKFKENLEKNINKLIEDKYEDVESRSNIEVTADFKKMDFNIKKVTVVLANKGVKKVEKVDLSNNKEKKKSSKELAIKELLKKELEIPKESIEVYDE